MFPRFDPDNHLDKPVRLDSASGHARARTRLRQQIGVHVSMSVIGALFPPTLSLFLATALQPCTGMPLHSTDLCGHGFEHIIAALTHDHFLRCFVVTVAASFDTFLVWNLHTMHPRTRAQIYVEACSPPYPWRGPVQTFPICPQGTVSIPSDTSKWHGAHFMMSHAGGPSSLSLHAPTFHSLCIRPSQAPHALCWQIPSLQLPVMRR